MRRSCIFDLVNGIQDGVQRRVHTYGNIGAAYIVIYGSRHANHRKTQLVQGQTSGKRTVAADDYQTFNAGLIQVAQRFPLAFEGLEFQRPRRAQKGAAPAQNSPHGAIIQIHHFAVHESGETTLDAAHCHTQTKSCAGSRPNARVKSGTVSAAGQYANSFHAKLLFQYR